MDMHQIPKALRLSVQVMPVKKGRNTDITAKSCI